MTTLITQKLSQSLLTFFYYYDGSDNEYGDDGDESKASIYTLTHSKKRVIYYLQDPVLCECMGHLIPLDDHIFTQDLDGVEMVAALVKQEKLLYIFTSLHFQYN